MSASNLLNLNVDTLFEQHSVPEIDIVHKKIQAVVENKREELRLMVGERYRDLLQAADTIVAMQESSSSLIAQVESISTECRKLNEQQLIGFETNDAADMLRNRTANKQLNNYFGTMVQIKLLTALPELIWSRIDQEQFYAATELFIFSRHISTGLQLDAGNPLMRHLPVAKKQWEILKPFHGTIKQSLLEVLEREELNAETAVDCLLSLLLLENNNLNGVLKTFLQLRCAAFLGCLSDASRNAEAERRRVKDRILASLKILNSTMELMGKCFLDNGLMFKKLAEHSDPNAPPTIVLMDSDDAQFSHMLPEIISNFRPKFDIQTLDNAQVREDLQHWLADTKRIASVQLKGLFDFVSTMSTIQEIKSEATACRRNLHFERIISTFQLSQTLDFYELKYVPLINQRVRDIIHDSWSKAMQTTFEALERALPEVAANQLDIWTECAADLPLSLEQALNDDYKVKKLLMKSKGYGSEIIALCAEFDGQLAGIVSEMNVLLEEQATRAEDKLALIVFLRETAEAQLTHFLSRVKSLHLTQAQRIELLFVVRSCVALVELCPNLKICFCQRSGWRQWVGNVAANSSDHWNRICLLMEEESLHFWQQIVDGILLDNDYEQHFPRAITHYVVLEDFANWETVVLEQKDEHDTAIRSTFRIPNQPRISLQSHLFALIRTLNTAIPQTLPAKVLHYYNGQLLAQLLHHYQTLSVDKCTASSQNVALQLYFDLKFLQSIFAVSRDERALTEKFQSLQNTLKDIIDPFDFELFAEHISTNVKRSVARFNCQLGVLTPQPQSPALASVAVGLVQERDPNVLALSSSGSTSLWFPLLPIVTPANMGATSKRPVALNSEKSTPTRQRQSATTTTTTTSSSTPTASVTATSRKGDTTKSKSFFGAMSQEWFR